MKKGFIGARNKVLLLPVDSLGNYLIEKSTHLRVGNNKRAITNLKQSFEEESEFEAGTLTG